MKLIIIFVCINLTVLLPVQAATLNNLVEDDYGTITYDIDVGQKTYSYRLETPDGTIKHEKGHFEDDPATDEGSLVAEGGYGYDGDDGKRYIVTYKADKNGYQPYVTFGTRFGGYGGAMVGGAAPGAGGTPGKQIDPALLCSLAGSGCK